MKLYETAEFIKKIVIYFGIGFFFLLIILNVYPAINNFIAQQSEKNKPQEINYFVNKINFTQDANLQFDTSETQVLYIGNPETQWENLETKALKVYEYNFSLLEDIDYTPTAKRIALNLGYDDLSLIDNAEISNKYRWDKNNLIFEINKVNKKMIQTPKIASLSIFKPYLSSGNFITLSSPNGYIRNFLAISGRFSSDELSNINYEPTFLSFQGDKLIETNNISSELSYVKIFRLLDGFKVVSKKYDFPQIYFYVSSLRPEVEASFKNYRFPHFKLNKIDYKVSFEEEFFDLNPLPNVVNQSLKNNNFIISDIKLNNSEFGYIPPANTTKISTISIENFEIGYYDNFDETSLNQYVQPIYIFKGSIELNTGERGKITLYTPALDSKYFRD